jgi:fimbrial chaperone protein
MRGALARTLTVIALLIVCAAAAFAASFKVDPISVTIPHGGESELVSVINDGDTPIRFQIIGDDWQQSLDGQMQLQPSDALIFFPKLFTLQPGEVKKVRVGVTTPASNLEQSYRLTIAELPALEKVLSPSKGAGVNTLVRLSIPVFVAPATAPKVNYDIRAPVFSGGKLHFEYVNDGNTHVLLNGVHVIGRNASGTTLFDYADKAWYVLAGGRRAYAIPVRRAQCQAVSSLQIVFTPDSGKDQTQTFPSHLDCSSASP